MTDTNGKGACIVIADDDPAIVNLLRENLTDLGHQVVCAFDGQMAMRQVRKSLPDLVILDVNMPMTNGLKVFEFLRASEDTGRIPIIFITGELSKDVYPSIAGASRVAHVKKPFDLDNFNSLVTQFLTQFPVSY